MLSKHINTAFILGAGLGTRLRPLTQKIPKPLLEIGGRPIITYAMEHLRAIGVQRFIVNTHHCAEKYSEAFPDGNWQGIPITFRHESILLDTAGGIKNIEDLIANEERILVYNSGPLLNVNIDRNGFICDLRHTLNNQGIQSCLFAGIYIVETKFLQRLEAGRVESIVPPLIEMIKENRCSVGGVVIDSGYWHDVGTLEEYEKLNQKGF
jgi:NDP-sugar pyrophosphorylase family protein